MSDEDTPRHVMDRFLRGAWCLSRAGRMIARSRKLVLMSLAPFLLCLALYAVLFIAALFLERHLVDAIIGPGVWWRTLIRTALMIGLPLALLVILAFTYTIVCFALAAPLYDPLSVAVERMIGGGVPPGPRGVVVYLADTGRSVVYALLMLAFAVCIFVLGLLLPPVTTVLAFVVSAHVLALGCLDYPMSRRRMPLVERLRYGRRHLWELFGLGLPLLMALMVPFVGALFLPLGVAGGTILFVQLGGGGSHGRTRAEPSQEAR
jgi:CysZ protein